VKRILLTGMSGTGKSSVIRELAVLGYKAIDTDDGKTGNPFGKAPGDIDRILGDLAAVEPRLRKAADHEIRTTTPLTDVVAKVLHLASLYPDGHNTPEPPSAAGGG
jgi:hypothetical protein